MPDPETAAALAAPAASAQLEGGAYEVIRARLERGAADLRGRLGKLNGERQAVFGAIEPELVATERVTTKNNCTPRDMVAIGGGVFLFGYNVQLGLKSTTELSDVFAVYRHDSETHIFHALGLSDLIEGDGFADDFKYLYKYYKETLFVKFMVRGPHLFMAFRIGRDVDDLKTFKFRIGEGKLEYVGNRSDHEYVFPPQQEFDWVRAHREMHRPGAHPHISVDDRLFVETIGGDLTVKVEDNTETGQGVYSEPVDNADQTLDDAEVFYAIVGSLILLQIKPYQEEQFRILVFNEKTGRVERIDSIRHSCVLLPDDHGIIFADGYHLQTGETKIFANGLDQMVFERRIASSNGEDFLFVFYNRRGGEYVLMPYNLISQQVDTPILCSGYSLFGSGEMIYFRAEEEPGKHHALQVWQTPYTAGDHAPPCEAAGSYLYKIGNADVVRCMAECHEVLTLLGKDDSYGDLYVDLAKKTGDICDSYFWIGQSEAGGLREPLEVIRGAAAAAIDEFDKVQRLRKAARDETGRVGDAVRKILSAAEHTRPDDILGFVHRLAELRSVRGEVIGLRELRYVDPGTVDTLEADVVASTDKVSAACVNFLLKPEALDPYRKAVATQQAKIGKLDKVTEADGVGEAIAAAGGELEMLIEIVGNLKIEDATQTTAIIDDISTIYAELNAVKVALKNRRRELARVEGEAQFGAQVKLLDQAVINYLDLCETPEKCEEFLTKTMVTLEELEGKFGEFDEYITELAEKREGIYEAFETRKQALLEERGRRAGALLKSAERILGGIRRRLEGFGTVNEINGYFAGDLMIEKVRDIIARLTKLGDSVKADDVSTRLKTVREDAVRQLKDRQELFVDGKDIIQLGKHRFNVNTQDLELTAVPRDGEMFFHLNGTEFFEHIDDEGFLDTRPVWEQTVVSENGEVYRAEYLAWKFLEEVEGAPGGSAADTPGGGELAEAGREFMAPRYAEGYTKGVHDRDAAKILEALLPIHRGAGLLKHPPAERALGLLFWQAWGDAAEKEKLAAKLRSFGMAALSFPGLEARETYIAELRELLASFLDRYAVSLPRLAGCDVDEAALYLFHELLDPEQTSISAAAGELVGHFKKTLTARRLSKKLEQALAELDGDTVARYQALTDWLAGLLCAEGGAAADQTYLPEAAVQLLRGFKAQHVVEVELARDIDGLSGAHPRVSPEGYRFDYLEFTARLRHFCREAVPRYESFVTLKTALVTGRRERMRLDEFKPRVMSSFVRNRLLDEVYLPLVGDNLAKQMGTAGDETRTDRMGMLLLVSPPGYGKTTLMEYIANRLGVTFMKINGPALGHDVTSLDPEDAPNAGAREEILKLNLALEMGDNVMIYLDDIQHCHSEFLQKFISLCDAQRKIEGVYNGRAKTYDLRGKKVAVVMAGNPYTESGGKFQIPDMLANRADTYNLGDIIGAHARAFENSYIENALTSNPVMGKLASRSQKDVYAVMHIAETGGAEGVDFEGNYTADEIEELVSVTRKLMRVRDSVLRVNQEYIRSAATEDAYRTEPAFKLQGSYRNMNRMAEKILPLMTDGEVEAAIIDHYENESQTLTSGAEANLLKFKEMEGLLEGEEATRWEEIVKTFSRNQLLGGGGEDDPVSRVVGAMGAFSKGLDDIRETIVTAGQSYSQPQTLAEQTVEQLQGIIAGLRAVPVDVEIKVQPVEEAPSRPQKKTAKKKSAAPKLPVDIESDVQQGD